MLGQSWFKPFGQLVYLKRISKCVINFARTVSHADILCWAQQVACCLRSPTAPLLSGLRGKSSKGPVLLSHLSDNQLPCTMCMLHAHSDQVTKPVTHRQHICMSDLPESIVATAACAGK